jgi:hypothetical protein
VTFCKVYLTTSPNICHCYHGKFGWTYAFISVLIIAVILTTMIVELPKVWESYGYQCLNKELLLRGQHL